METKDDTQRRKVLSKLDNLTIDQAAFLVRCTDADIESLLRSGQIRPYVIVGDRDKFTYPVSYLLANKDLIMDEPPEIPPSARERGIIEIGVSDVDKLSNDTKAEIEFPEFDAFLYCYRRDLRILTVDAKRLVPAEPVNEPTGEKPMRTDQRHRERCRAIAALLWAIEPTMTIEDMIDRQEITEYGQEHFGYERKTLRNWINELCPNRSPGRRPKNPRPVQE